MSNKTVEFLDLPKSTLAQGEMTLPGSKSISNRVLLIAALAQGRTKISGLLDSDDTRVMLSALKTLGVSLEKFDEQTYAVQGIDTRAGFPVKEADIFLGNAGTAFRPLTAALSVIGGEYYLHGVPRMHERPIGDLVTSLRSFGCSIDYGLNEGYPPLQIHKSVIDVKAPIEIEGSVSSQFLTALLMVSPLIAQRQEREVVIQVKGELISKPYIAITLNLMARFGVQVAHENWSRFVVPADACYQAIDEIHVEGDASSASYFMALGLLGGGPIRLQGIGRYSIQGDIQFAQVLEHMGAQIDMADNYIDVKRANGAVTESEPSVACAGASYGGIKPLRAFDMDFNLIPDAAMTAAVLALYADGPCTLRNIASWRVKETDRIDAMHKELEKLGAIVSSGPDWLRVEPPQKWQTASIDTYDDHRMAMCFSLATFGPVGVRIMDPNCVAKTFPTYFDVYRQLVK
ncbi:3-phosphoshikimate 1-carboxyvinyltransferase [Pelistega europaea]|uniref:3-phosphoshikimate 1-carboxyvinyltransferase n=1 Tax=Pelistega europaea TaxID=106147 RepID=A0A7Y4P6S4_9BURK|nr:3-phosphoshikimate 1-carboxyvinyltransferase [Pelistega europaea]NOL50219.1 3-phosphoshikimate 1-carboxyvinyltransferase [Pelistega europaea]